MVLDGFLMATNSIVRNSQTWILTSHKHEYWRLTNMNTDVSQTWILTNMNTDVSQTWILTSHKHEYTLKLILTNMNTDVSCELRYCQKHYLNNIYIQVPHANLLSQDYALLRASRTCFSSHTFKTEESTYDMQLSS